MQSISPREQLGRKVSQKLSVADLAFNGQDDDQSLFVAVYNERPSEDLDCFHSE